MTIATKAIITAIMLLVFTIATILAYDASTKLPSADAYLLKFVAACGIAILGATLIVLWVA